MADDMEMRLLDQENPKGKEKKKRPSGPPDETDYQPVDWKKIALTKKYIPLYIIGILLIIATVLLSVYQDEAVEKLRPFSDKVRDLPAGWLIPIALILVLSFPPLFGEEIIEILCGVVYGLGIGFGIVAAGTFLGELSNWFLFKYALRRKSAKLERTNLNYGAMARMVREGSFWIILVIRLSAIPPNLSTAVFSTCDVKFWHFAIATFFSLPKQIFLVYLGVLLVEEKKEDNTTQTVVLAIVFVITIAMAIWIWRKMKIIKRTLLEEQEQRRRAKAAQEGQDEEQAIGGEWSSLTQDSGYGAQNGFNNTNVPYGNAPYDNNAPYGATYGATPPYDAAPPYAPTAAAAPYDPTYDGNGGRQYGGRPY